MNDLPNMDTRIGLDYIVENREYVPKLGTALDTNNLTVKKQVFELLSALCAYSAEGYARALETLEHYKVSRWLILLIWVTYLCSFFLFVYFGLVLIYK